MSKQELLQAFASRGPAATGRIARRSFDHCLQDFFGSSRMRKYAEDITDHATQVDYMAFINMICEEETDAAPPPALRRTSRRAHGWRSAPDILRARREALPERVKLALQQAVVDGKLGELLEKAQAIATARIEAHKLLCSLNLEQCLADAIPKNFLLMGCKGDVLAGIFSMQDSDIDRVVTCAVDSLTSQIKTAIQNGRVAREAAKLNNNTENRGAKFTGVLQGGSLDDFHKGVTGIVGEPNVSLKDGVRKEHEELPDATILFTTNNYGITTDPKTEHTLIAEFSDVGGENVEVQGTRRCSKPDGTAQEDRRTLRPIAYFSDLDMVKAVHLTEVEILAVILYTGPMFMLYNGILRGFGSCGEVSVGVCFWSKDGRFKTEFESQDVLRRMEIAGHKYASTIHCLASAVKKLQRVRSGVQGTWLYRGLGGLDVNEFLSGPGFTEKAFSSTTESLPIALEYSGAARGLAGTVLAIEMSEVDQGAVLQKFSQYPAEKETLWNACSYMEAIKGKEEWRDTEWGPVKLLYIKMNASGRALTVEDLEGQRKTIVVNMLKTLQGDIVRSVNNATEGVEFQNKARGELADHQNSVSKQGVLKDRRMFIQDFVKKAKVGVNDIVNLHTDKKVAWFHSDENFAKAVSSAASLPELARCWVRTYQDYENRKISAVGEWNFKASQKELRLLKEGQLQESRRKNEEATTKRLASEICAMRNYVKQSDAIDEITPERGGDTSLQERCWDGDMLAVRLLLEAGAVVEHANANGARPLHVALGKGHTEVAKSLLQAGASPDARNGNWQKSALHLAAEHGFAGLVELLLEKRADLEAEDEDRQRPLYLALARGHTEAAKSLLQAGASLGAKSEWGRSALHYASSGGDVELVGLLLKKRADLEAEDRNQQRPLCFALVGGQTEVAKSLLQAGASLEAKDKWGQSALHYAASGGDAELVGLLLEKGLDREAEDRNQQRPLHRALEWGRTEAAKSLLQAGASLEAKGNCLGWSALHYAAFGGDAELVGLLLKKGLDLEAEDRDRQRPLHLALERGRTEAAKSLLQAGASREAKGKLGWSVLHYAAKQGFAELVKLMLEKGADLEAEDEDRLRPLHLALERGHTEVAKSLLQAGASFEAKGRMGWSALHYAAFGSDAELAGLLLRKGADLEAEDRDQRRPLHLALSRGRTEVAKSLLQAGASPEAKCECERNALHYAAFGGDAELVGLLLKKGLDLEAEDRDQHRPLHLALSLGRIEVTKSLLQAGASLEAKGEYERSALHYAASGGEEELVGLLLEKRADLEAEDRDQHRPLHLALSGGHIEVTKSLFQAGASFEANGEYEQSALHYAASFGDAEVVGLLLEKGADLEAKDMDQQRPLHLALQREGIEVAKSLLQAGASFEAKDKRGQSVLHYAASGGDAELVGLLPLKGLDLEAEDGEQRRPLRIAAELRHWKAAAATKALLEARADVQAKDSNGKTAADFAWRPSVKVLLCEAQAALKASDRVDT